MQGFQKQLQTKKGQHCDIILCTYIAILANEVILKYSNPMYNTQNHIETIFLTDF